MVFHWSLSDSKSPQVSRTLLNNAVVWIVSTRPPTSKSSSPFCNPLVTEVFILLFTFFQFYSVVSRDSKFYNFVSSLFCWLLLSLVFWPRLGDLCVCQSPIGVVCVIFHDRCWVVHIPFVYMVKFEFLAHLPVDHFADPIISSLLFLLRQFAAFTYYVIDGFISVTT